MYTVRETLNGLTGQFLSASVPDAPGCARYLIMDEFSLKYGELPLHMQDMLDDEKLGRLKEKANRLLSGVPLQYVIGNWDFCTLCVKTDERALIPRPETEELAYMALNLAKERSYTSMADLGCGSGVIGLFLASSLPTASVTLMDISPAALSLCEENAQQLGLYAKIMQHNMCTPLPFKVDMIVSNPPYIPSADIPLLDAQVREHEPILALDGGRDGLDFYRALAQRFCDSLLPGGSLLAEFGIGQAQAIEEIFVSSGAHTRIITDMFGKERIILAHKSE